jgi:hypothetical protein
MLHLHRNTRSSFENLLFMAIPILVFAAVLLILLKFLK